MQRTTQWWEDGVATAAERRRVEAVVETLAKLRGSGESLAAVAHDARNMVTALGLYCELLEEPGVLAVPFAHYGSELRLLTAASRRLVEKLVALDTPVDAHLDVPRARGAALAAGDGVDAGRLPAKAAMAARRQSAANLDSIPTASIANLAAELLANRNLLAALAGRAVAVTVEAEGGAQPVLMTGEDLTRVLVNLVKNAAEAMPQGGRIGIRLTERAAEAGREPQLAITVEDSGPGIPPAALQRIFEPGYTTRTAPDGWPTAHRGLGLAISRSLVEAAGGRLAAVHRAAPGARFEMELPVARQGRRD
jgi:signal transduction histidine kinase